MIETQSGGKLRVSSADGRTVSEQEVKSGRTEIALPKGLAAGIYLLRYEPEEGSAVNRKLVYQP